MKISLSTHGFSSKPDSRVIRNMSYKTVDVTPKELLYYCLEGYAFQNYYDFIEPTYKFINPTKDSHIKIEHYVGSWSINIDCDHMELPMEEMYNKVEMKPTFCYEGWSNGTNGYEGFSYRFVYVFDGLIEGANAYRALYAYIANKNNIKFDTKAKSPYQYMNGTSSNNKFIYNGIIYNINEYSNIIKGTNPFIYNNINIEEERESNIIGFVPFTNKEFESDYNNLSYKDIINKYMFDYTPLDASFIPEVDEDTALINLEGWYYEIKRNFNPINGFTKKLKDGEGRKNKLYINSLIRRLINPDITIDELIYALVYEICFYINNSQDPITKEQLLSIAKYAFIADLSQFNYKGRKFMVNDAYVEKHGGIKREIANKEIAKLHKEKKEAKYALIGEFYDFSLTIQENIDIMNNDPAFIEAGYIINKQMIKRWKQDNGLQRGYTRHIETPTTDDNAVDDVIVNNTPEMPLEVKEIGLINNTMEQINENYYQECIDRMTNNTSNEHEISSIERIKKSKEFFTKLGFKWEEIALPEYKYAI